MYFNAVTVRSDLDLEEGGRDVLRGGLKEAENGQLRYIEREPTCSCAVALFLPACSCTVTASYPALGCDIFLLLPACSCLFWALPIPRNCVCDPLVSRPYCRACCPLVSQPDCCACDLLV